MFKTGTFVNIQDEQEESVILIERWSVFLIENHCLWKCQLICELTETTCVSANHLYSY